MKSTPVTTSIEPQVGCLARAMEIIGNKWTALILRDMFAGPKRFCELEKSVGRINPRTLSQRLDDLEAHGIIRKQSFAEVPPRTEYSLKRAKTCCPSCSKWLPGAPNITPAASVARQGYWQ
jgi:DNA-binding HxlR family transcriptional regulator